MVHKDAEFASLTTCAASWGRMPARRQPPSLNSIALRAVSQSLTYQVSVAMTASGQRHERRLRWLRDSLAAVPENMKAAVVAACLRSADLFLNYRNNHPARRVLERLLVALLPDTTRRFNLTIAESYPLREALLRRLQALPQLRELTLTQSLHVHTSADLAVSALHELRRLRVVRAPWLCSDDMAAALAQHCPDLEVLDASESCRLTDRGAGALAVHAEGLAEGAEGGPRGPRLRCLLLTGCRLSERGYERLLAALPALQRIGRCPSLGAVVRAVSAARTPALPLALTEWDSDHAPAPAEAALCPAVTSVCLSDVAVVPDEDGGTALPADVQRLRVSWVGLRDHAAPLRLRLPAALTHLDMMDHEVSVADVVQLGRQCPSLRVLKLTVLCQDDAPAAPAHPDKEAPFRQLREFHLYSGPGPLLEYVLLHATALVRLAVTPGLPGDSVPPWTDAVMRRVVAANPLAELESFSLACPCALTMATVYLLVLGCPRLRALFDLNDWAVTDTQRQELREVVAANNWDLELGLGSL